ncbi:hypothetical protein Clacol_000577 [Clathrus columnatus]|uniref:Transcriptional activator HAP2 n=1 Tax=Clathrus columnatus TaxID=1419009 RepID=A0AAV5A035_9AGAM|nr:hypothetical protein Clacol_000577 [Clathrus columnatus]
MDNSLDRNQLWSPPLSRPYPIQGHGDFLLAGKLHQSQMHNVSSLINSPHPAQQPPSLTRRSQPGAPPSSQIQLEEHHSAYSRTHIPFPQPQRYLPDPTLPPHHPHHPHPHSHLAHRSSYPIPRVPSDLRDNTPGPSHTSAEDDVDDYQNGNNSHGPDAEGSSERIARAGMETEQPLDEEPLYVNAKQYNRILKRRIARARLEELHRLSKQRKPYLHESRHRHAMRRPRGPGGRFLTAEEIAAQQKANESADPNATQLNPNPSAEERKALKASSESVNAPPSSTPVEPSNPSSSSNNNLTGSATFPPITGGLANNGSANGNSSKVDFRTFAEPSSGLAQDNYSSTGNVQQFLNLASSATTNNTL